MFTVREKAKMGKPRNKGSRPHPPKKVLSGLSRPSCSPGRPLLAGCRLGLGPRQWGRLPQAAGVTPALSSDRSCRSPARHLSLILSELLVAARCVHTLSTRLSHTCHSLFLGPFAFPMAFAQDPLPDLCLPPSSADGVHFLSTEKHPKPCAAAPRLLIHTGEAAGCRCPWCREQRCWRQRPRPGTCG